MTTPRAADTAKIVAAAIGINLTTFRAMSKVGRRTMMYRIRLGKLAYGMRIMHPDPISNGVIARALRAWSIQTAASLNNMTPMERSSVVLCLGSLLHNPTRPSPARPKLPKAFHVDDVVILSGLGSAERRGTRRGDVIDVAEDGRSVGVRWRGMELVHRVSPRMLEVAERTGVLPGQDQGTAA